MLSVTLVLTGCAGSDDELTTPATVTGVVAEDVLTTPPTVTGVVAGSARHAALTEASDGYYEGMSLTSPDPRVVDADDQPISIGDLVTGDEVEVWVGDVCRESFPVQCDLVAVRVVG